MGPDFVICVCITQYSFVLLLVDCVLIVVGCAMFDAFVCGKQCCRIALKLKQREDCTQLVGRVKCEQEVSVLCW
jgi:hypothetical protein